MFTISGIFSKGIATAELTVYDFIPLAHAAAWWRSIRDLGDKKPNWGRSVRDFQNRNCDVEVITYPCSTQLPGIVAMPGYWVREQKVSSQPRCHYHYYVTNIVNVKLCKYFIYSNFNKTHKAFVGISAASPIVLF